MTFMTTMGEKTSKYILVVDDEEMIRFTVRDFMERIGYKCDIAANGVEALCSIGRQDYDLVISDIVMPEMDGIQLMKEAKRSYPDLLFIMMTGHTSEYDYIDIIEAGAADYMTKPFKMMELNARLARIEREKRILKELNEKNSLLKTAIDRAEEMASKTRAANHELQKEIGERKQTEEALKEAKEYIENIISSMADSLFALKPDLTIGMANRAASELLGYSESELLGEPFDKLVFERGSFGRNLIGELAEKGFLRNDEFAFRAKSGEKIMVSFLGSAMYRDSGREKEIMGIICAAHDTRAIRELQNQVFQAEKMAAIGILAAGVAHEIKNPLAIIMQGMEYVKFSLLSKDAADPLLEPVDRIRAAALRADKIVKGLLDFSRQTSATLAEVDAALAIEETITLVKHQLNLKGIRIIRQFPENAPKIMADNNQIKQVFINLLVNSVEAMPDGGIIKIELAPDGRNNLLISFADSGCGIPEDKLKKVLDPFYSTKTKTGSTGLGLSISQGIIEKLKGELRLESEMNKGTKVTISLPCAS